MAKATSKVVRIACQGAATMPLKDLLPFQGALKSLADEDYERLKKLILRLGFSFPFHIWREKAGKVTHHHILDGHQRLETLSRMAADPEIIVPLEFPVDWVEAGTLKEAKEKVLASVSQFGKVEAVGLADFAKEAGISFVDLANNFRFPEIDMSGFGKAQAKKNEEPPPEDDEEPEFTEEDLARARGLPLPESATILHGDCFDHLKKMPDNSVDAVVTDPPYGLGKVEDIGALLNAWATNQDPDKHIGKCGFMGKEWDRCVPPPSIWREVIRVLKPGGHALVFAGTRTQDLMGISLRIAGFEVRDTVSWLYGSGFPKSLDLSKAIDKQAGAERQTTGYRKESGPDFSDDQFKAQGSMMQAMTKAPRKKIAITDPATAAAAAAAWEGWGTALKPACEPAILCRKPISEGSIAENVLKWSTGALNIDACRIGTHSEKNKSNRESSKDSGKNPNGKRDRENELPDLPEGICGGKGAFGADEIQDLQSGMPLERNVGASECPMGRRAISGRPGIYPDQNSIGLFPGASGDNGGASRAPVDSQGSRASFESRQSGQSNRKSATSAERGDAYYGVSQSALPQDGAPSASLGRFPSNLVLSHSPGCELVGDKKVKAIAPAGKPSRGQPEGKNSSSWSKGATTNNFIHYGNPDGTETVEAWECVEGCAVRLLDEQSIAGGMHSAGVKRDGGKSKQTNDGALFGIGNHEGNGVRFGDSGGASRFFYIAKASRSERNAGLEGMPEVVAPLGDERPSGHSMSRLDGRPPRVMQNGHPTVKPVALMRYLVNLITPPNGVILEPFMGSGTTGVAAIKGGFRFIGIERELPYFEIASARIKLAGSNAP